MLRETVVTKPNFMGLLAGLPLVTVLVLVIVLIWVSFQGDLSDTAGASFTLEHYESLFGDNFIYTVIWNTVEFVGATVLVSVAVGLPIAWMVERTAMRGEKIVYGVMTVGLIVPPLYTAIGWTYVAHPRIGLVNVGLQDLLGEGWTISIGTPLGMGFVAGLGLAAVVFILCAQMFRAMNVTLEEAAHVHGISGWKTLRRVTLPLAMPGILASAFYVLTTALATFEVPAVLGLGNRVYVLSTYVFSLVFLPGIQPPQYGVSAAVGVVMIAVAVTCTVAYARVLRQSHRYQVVTGKAYKANVMSIGRWEIACWAFIALYLLGSTILPLITLAFVAFSPYLMPPSLENLDKLTLNVFGLINWELVFRGVYNTILLMAVVPIAVLATGFSISWLVVRLRSRARYILDFAAFLPHALPDLILALSAFLLALFLLPGWLPLYGTVWLIAIVYLIHRVPFATRAFNSALLQIHRELEEAAHVSGLSELKAAWQILIPLIRPALYSVWLWTALIIYRELTVATILVSHDSLTVQTVIWSFWSSGSLNQAAAISLLAVIVLLPFVILVWKLDRQVRL